MYNGDRGMVIVGAAMHRGIGGEDIEDSSIEKRLLDGMLGSADALTKLIARRKHSEKFAELKGKKDYDAEENDDDEDFDEDEYDVRRWYAGVAFHWCCRCWSSLNTRSRYPCDVSVQQPGTY